MVKNLPQAITLILVITSVLTITYSLSIIDELQQLTIYKVYNINKSCSNVTLRYAYVKTCINPIPIYVRLGNDSVSYVASTGNGFAIVTYRDYDNFKHGLKDKIITVAYSDKYFAFYKTDRINISKVTNIVPKRFKSVLVKLFLKNGKLNIEVYNTSSSTLLIRREVSAISTSENYLAGVVLPRFVDYGHKVIYQFYTFLFIPKSISYNFNFRRSFYIFYVARAHIHDYCNGEIDADRVELVVFEVVVKSNVSGVYVYFRPITKPYVLTDDDGDWSTTGYYCRGIVDEWWRLKICVNNNCTLSDWLKMNVPFTFKNRVDFYYFKPCRNVIEAALENKVVKFTDLAACKAYLLKHYRIDTSYITTYFKPSEFGVLNLVASIESVWHGLRKICCLSFKYYTRARELREISNNGSIKFIYLPRNFYNSYMITLSEPLVTIEYFRKGTVEIKNVSIIGSDYVYPGSEVSINVTLANPTSVNTSCTVIAQVDEETVSKVVNVNAMSRTSIILKIKVPKREGDYELVIKVVIGDEVKSVKKIIHVYYPKLSINAILYKGNDTRYISGFKGGSSISLTVKICNSKTGGKARIDVVRGSDIIASSESFYISFNTCVEKTISFITHDDYKVKNYIIKIVDLVEDRVDDEEVIQLIPGKPKFKINSFKVINCTSVKELRKCYVLPNAKLIVDVNVSNIGLSSSEFRIRVLRFTSSSSKIVEHEEKHYLKLDSFKVIRLIFNTPFMSKDSGETVRYRIEIDNPYSSIDDFVEFEVTVHNPMFRITGFEYELTVLNGTSFTYCVKVRNLGTSYFCSVQLFIESNKVNETRVFIEKDNEKLICLEGIAPKYVGNYKLRVFVMDDWEHSIDDNITVKLVVKIVPMVKIIDINPSIVITKPGKPFFIKVTVVNLGSEGNAVIQLLDPSGKVQSSKSIHLLQNQKITVDLMGTAPGREGVSETYTVVATTLLNDRIIYRDVKAFKVKTFTYVSKLIIEDINYPKKVTELSSFEVKARVRNIGNATSKYVVFITPPSKATCTCLENCKGYLLPSSSIETRFNCTAPSGSGTYTYILTVRDEVTDHEVSKSFNIEVISKTEITIDWWVILIVIAIITTVVIIYAVSKKSTTPSKQGKRK